MGAKHIKLTAHPGAGIEVGERIRLPIRLPVPDGKISAPDELAKPEGRGLGE